MKIIPFSAILNLITTECFAIWQGGVWHEFFFSLLHYVCNAIISLWSKFWLSRFLYKIFWRLILTKPGACTLVINYICGKQMPYRIWHIRQFIIFLCPTPLKQSIFPSPVILKKQSSYSDIVLSSNKRFKNSGFQHLQNSPKNYPSNLPRFIN